MKPIYKYLLLALLAAPSPALAQGCIEYSPEGALVLNENGRRGAVAEVTSYFAILAERDLYNSRGARLGDVRAILQQDRANLHKSGVPDRIYNTYADGSRNIITEQMDGYFTTLERRSLLSSLPYYQYCLQGVSDDFLEQEIVAGRLSAAGLTVTLFRHPNGGLAVLLSPTG